MGKEDRKDFFVGKGKAAMAAVAGLGGIAAQVAGKELRVQVAKEAKKAVAVAVPAAIAAIKNIR